MNDDAQTIKSLGLFVLGIGEKEELKIRSHIFQKIRYLSNNFAGKEAFSKVLGLGFSEGVSLKEIEILF